MSDNGDGYGKDIGYVIGADGSIDIELGDSGDINIIGGIGTDALSVKRKNAIQQVILRLLTPAGSLLDQHGNPIAYGSDLPSMVGAKNTELNKLVMKAYIMLALQDYNYVESILKIDIDISEKGVTAITVAVKFYGDNEIAEVTTLT